MILDFSVPWCEPCDEIHQSHVLQTLYDQSGPGTSADKLMVFLISSGPEMFLHGEQGFSRTDRTIRRSERGPSGSGARAP